MVTVSCCLDLVHGRGCLDLLYLCTGRGRGLDPRHSCQMGLRIAVGLQELHQEGFAHLDVKPDNVLLDEADNPVLCDFGLARQVLEDVYMTSSKVGTTPYM